MASGVFITGTDTGVGKTWVTTRLIERLRRQHINAAGMKPIECGGRDDSTAIWRASEAAELTLDEVNPITIPDPVAPIAATNPIQIDFSQLRENLSVVATKAEFVIVEGAGGWLVPLDKERTTADLAALCGFPIVVVAANRLGVLNHTLLTTRAIASHGLECRGVFLNRFGPEDLSQSSNAAILRQLLGDIPVFADDLDALAKSLLPS